MRSRLIPLVVTAVALNAAVARAQGVADSGSGRPHTREGFWIGFGLGAGSLGCDDCDDRETAFSGNLKLGGTINPHFLLGAETNGWTKSEDGFTLTYGNLSAVAYYYPSITSGFHLKGGLGIANLRADANEFGNDSETGTGAVIGLGYDARMRPNFSLTPYVNFMGGKFDGGSMNLFQFGLGFTWH